MISVQLQNSARLTMWPGLLTCILLLSMVPIAIPRAEASSTPDFIISPSVNALSIPLGEHYSNWDITVRSINGFSGSISLVMTPSSSALSCEFTTHNNTVTLSIPFPSIDPYDYAFPTCSAVGPAGTYSLTITGTGGSQTHSVVLAANITDFSISGPSTASLSAGPTQTESITISSLYGLAGRIPLRITSSPGLSAACPSSVTLAPDTSTTIACPLASPTAGTYNMTVTGSFTCNGCNGVETRSQTTVATVAGPSVPGFGVSTSGGFTVITGTSSSTVITLTSMNGFSGKVSLSTTLPAGLVASISRGTVNLSPSGTTTSILSVFSTDCQLGDYSVIFTGTAGSQSYFTSVPLSVAPRNPWPDNGYFDACADTPSLTMSPGSSRSSTITIVPANGGLGELVDLYAFPAPSTSSIGCQISPSILNFTARSMPLTSTLTCASSTPGNYAVEVAAAWNPPDHCPNDGPPGYTCPLPSSDTATIVEFVVGTFPLVSVVQGLDGNLYSSTSQQDGSWSNWQSLSGSSPSKPALCRSGPDRVDLVVRGNDDAIYQKAFTGGVWSTSWDKNPSGITIGQPACAVLGSSLYVVVIGATGELWSTTLDLNTNTWAPSWTDLTGFTQSTPSLTATPGRNRLDLVVRGYDEAVYHKSFINGTWQQTWDSPGGVVIDSPAVVSDGSILHIVAVGVTGEVWYNSLSFSSSTWTGWVDLQGSTPSTPAFVFTPGLYRGDLVVRGMDNVLYQKTMSQGSGGVLWSSWQSLNGLTTYAPTVASDFSSVRVEVVNLDGSLVFDSLQFNISPWSGWNGMAGSTNLTPSLA